MLPSLVTMLDLLERSPLLGELSVPGRFNHGGNFDPRKVALPRLRSLWIAAEPPWGIPSFLHNLVLPVQTDIDICTDLELGETFAHIVPAHNSLRFESLHGLRRLELVWDGREWSLLAYREPADYHSPALQIRATYPTSPGNEGPGARFFGEWPIETSQVETFVVSGNWAIRGEEDVSIERRQWARMLHALPGLKTLRWSTHLRKSLKTSYASSD
ncbi:hypothetical protein BV20DRAFT_963207 [Pilatotrama ljubarskyi]|nr:hypothetical protein BV20DRAFT_963207 [Pilatotrama ljubarskyi]